MPLISTLSAEAVITMQWEARTTGRVLIRSQAVRVIVRSEARRSIPEVIPLAAAGSIMRVGMVAIFPVIMLLVVDTSISIPVRPDISPVQIRSAVDSTTVQWARTVPTQD